MNACHRRTVWVLIAAALWTEPAASHIAAGDDLAKRIVQSVVGRDDRDTITIDIRSDEDRAYRVARALVADAIAQSTPR